jgi:hypothetical protein
VSLEIIKGHGLRGIAELLAEERESVDRGSRFTDEVRRFLHRAIDSGILMRRRSNLVGLDSLRRDANDETNGKGGRNDLGDSQRPLNLIFEKMAIARKS